MSRTFTSGTALDHRPIFRVLFINRKIASHECGSLSAVQASKGEFALMKGSVLLLAAALLAACQTSPADRAQISKAWLASSTFADEAADWGVLPPQAIFKGNYHSKTPTTVPGAKTIATGELQKLIASNSDVVLIDVLGGGAHSTIPTAKWLNGAGLGDNFEDRMQTRLAERLKTLTSGHVSRPLVFFCLSSECWLSYNAALRAVKLGYTDVNWYRGGQASWKSAGLPMETSVDSW